MAENPSKWKTDATMWGFSFPVLTRNAVNPMVIRDMGKNSAYAVGDDGVIARYRYGKPGLFEKYPSPTKANLNAIARGNILEHVAVGENGTILFLDSIHWNLTHSRDALHFEDVIFDSGLWVAVGWEGTPEDRESKVKGWIVTSEDGENWKPLTIPGFRFYSIEYWSGSWIVAGARIDSFHHRVPALLESRDLINWTPLNLKGNHFPQDAYFGHVVHGGDYWVGVLYHQPGDAPVQSYIVGSEDTVAWTVWRILPGIASKPLYNLADWRFLFNLDSSGSSPLYHTHMFGAEDGKHWKIRECLNPKTLIGHSMKYSDRYVVVGDSRVGAYVTKSPYSLHEDLPSLPAEIHDVEESEGQWIAVGHDKYVAISEDGLDWNQILDPFGSTMHRVLKRNDIWVAVGDGGSIWVSVDRVSWRKVHEQSGFYLHDMDYADGRWCVAGFQENDGLILTSTDLENWDAILVSHAIDQIEYGNGMWLALGNYGPHFLSIDGTDWESISRPEIIGEEAMHLTFGDGQWLEADGFSGGQGFFVKLRSSSDARNWETIIDWIGGGPTWYEGGRWWLGSLNMDVSWGVTDSFKHSTDGRNWVSIPFDTLNSHTSLAMIRDVLVRDGNVHLFQSNSRVTVHKLLIPRLGPESNHQQKDPILQMAYGNDRWLGIGMDQTVISEDGINWFEDHSEMHRMRHICFGDHSWGLMNFVHERRRPRSWVFSTYDIHSPPVERFLIQEDPNALKALSYSHGLWWILTSKDIVAVDKSFEPVWKFRGAESLSASEELVSMTFSSNAVKVLTNEGTLIQSDINSQYEQWSLSLAAERVEEDMTASKIVYQDIVFDQGLWQLVGIRKVDDQYRLWLEQSTDGDNWGGRYLDTLPLGSDARFKMKHANGWWVLCGGGGNDQESLVGIYISDNGQDWQLVHSLENSSVPTSVEFGGNQWIITLSDGTMMRSGPDNWLNADLSGLENTPKLVVQGKHDQHLGIEMSKDLKSWNRWTQLRTLADPATFEIPAELTTEDIFFRAVQPESD